MIEYILEIERKNKYIYFTIKKNSKKKELVKSFGSWNLLEEFIKENNIDKLIMNYERI